MLRPAPSILSVGSDPISPPPPGHLLPRHRRRRLHAPTPIQAQAIPLVLAGRDLLGIAQTGTGKTAAFALPILQRLAAAPRAARAAARAACLVLTPTRELAAQIAESFRTYGRHLRISRTPSIFGGVGQDPQVRALRARRRRARRHARAGCSTSSSSATLRLDDVEVFVLDEADRMLDMGFIRDVRKIVATLPEQAPDAVLLGHHAAGDRASSPTSMLHDPGAGRGDAGGHRPSRRIDQRVIFVDQADKRALLRAAAARSRRSTARWSSPAPSTAPTASPSSSSRPASAPRPSTATSRRTRASARSTASRPAQSRVLVATDIAARGIDVDGITHVVNFDLPNVPESYVHRIGRTARAGADGHRDLASATPRSARSCATSRS